MATKKCKPCGDGLTAEEMASLLPPPPGSVTVSTFDDPHACPPLNSPCLQKWAAEAAAYALLGIAVADWLASQTSLTLAAYRNALWDYQGKWYATECCLRGWIV